MKKKMQNIITLDLLKQKKKSQNENLKDSTSSNIQPKKLTESYIYSPDPKPSSSYMYSPEPNSQNPETEKSDERVTNMYVNSSDPNSEIKKPNHVVSMYVNSSNPNSETNSVDNLK